MQRRDAVLAGLFVLATSLLTSRGLVVGDDAVHLELAVAIATRGETTLRLDPGALWVPSRPIAGGLFYGVPEGLRSASAPGMALLALPLVAPAAWLVALDDGAPALEDVVSPLFTDDGTRSARALMRPIQRDPRVIAFCLMGPLGAALAVFFVALALGALELPRRVSWIALGALALGSPLVAFAGTGWTQLPVAAALACACWQLCERERRPGRGPGILGAALAVAIAVRPECLAFVPFFGMATFRTEQRWRRSPSRAMARLLLPILAVSIALALHGLPERGDGWDGRRWLEGTSGLLLSPRTGLVAFAPFVLLAPYGAWICRAEGSPLAWVLVGPPLVALAIFGGWFDWAASLAYGPRFLVPVLPMLALAFALALDRLGPRSHGPAIGLVVLGALVELPGALLAHGRLPDPERWLAPSALDAWRTLLAGRGAIGELGIDCASTYVEAYPLLALAVALAGFALARRAAARG